MLFSVIRRVAAWIAARGRRKQGPPRDPFARKAARLTPRPNGRSGSVAVAEPDEDW